MTVRPEIFDQAALEIASRGLTSAVLMSADGRVCVLGAVALVIGIPEKDLPVQDYTGHEDPYTAIERQAPDELRLLHDIVAERDPRRGAFTSSLTAIYMYSDDNGGWPERLQSLLSEAAKRARALQPA